MFVPALDDLYREYVEALSEGSLARARWVRVRGYWSFWSAVIAQAPLSLAKQLVALWKAVG